MTKTTRGPTTPANASNTTNTKAAPNKGENTPSLDEVHETLSESRRRHALRTLHEVGPVKKKELARYVAAIENEKPPSEITEKEHKRVVVSLHQAHLPYLSKLDIIAWDQSTNTVALGTNSDMVLRYIDGITLEDEEDEPQSLADRVASGAASFF